MWCGQCYSSSSDISFHIFQIQKDEEDEERFDRVWRRKWEDQKYHHARNGDHLMTPFECDLCIFIKLKHRYPVASSAVDRRLITCIRRINLDAFWARATSTVANNLRSVKKILTTSQLVELPGPFKSFGPMPLHDHCGYQVAIDMVLFSTQSARYSKDYTQFDTIRHLRSAFGTFDLISSKGATMNLTISGSGSQTREINQSPTSLIWFRRFYAGCRSRMGQVYKPNLALPTEIIVKVLELVRRDIRETKNLDRKFTLVIFGVYVAVSYVMSLRGSEGLMINLSTINKEWKRYQDCVIIALKGKIKGETNERDHIFPCSCITESGINMVLWIESLRLVHRMKNRIGGPATTTSSLDSHLHEYLIRLWEKGAEFPQEIKGEDDISERFSVFHSLRRGSNTRALNANVSQNDIDVINRWKSVESAEGKKPARTMRQHYAETTLLKAPFLRYTAAM